MTQYAVDYLRLSKEDDKKGESGSIINQRKIIRQYCRQYDIVLIKEFVDDDYSGGNFNRPGFQAMLAFLSSHREVDTVITKDLSRLGRDMSESSYYAERYFPEHGIRFLAINDSFDSEEENMLAPFQFAMNDMYLRDSSKKVKNALHVMMDNGEYCFGSPYGYKKDVNDIHHLVPDERTAPVVREIFRMASCGESTISIAKSLTQRGIVPPLRFRVENIEGANSGNSRYMSDAWNQTTVRRILKNPVYLGNTVLGKTKKVSPKSEVKRPVPVDGWRITEGTHEPLVDRKTHMLAEKNLSKKSSDYRQYEHVRKSIFGGIAYCATCGGAMCSSGTVYKGEREKYWYLTCQNIPQRSRCRCTHGARIKYSVLLDIVSRDINAVLHLTPEQKRSIVEAVASESCSASRAKELEKALRAAMVRSETIDKITGGIYEDLYTDKIPRDRAIRMLEKYDGESEDLKRQIDDIRGKLDGLKTRKADYDKFFAVLNDIVGDRTKQTEPSGTAGNCRPDGGDSSNPCTLDRATLLDLIDRIEIGPRQYEDGKQHGSRSKVPFTQEVTIFYKFIGKAEFQPS